MIVIKRLLYSLKVSPSLVSRWRVKATVSGVVEDFKFKISEGSDQNWCFPDSAQLAVSV